MAAGQSSSVGGERKLATMLFVDLSGFTELSLQEDPENVRLKIKPLLDGLIHIAELHGAWVSAVEGDGFLALFGVPVSREDDPARAVTAADRMRRFAGSRRDDLSVHMGIASGEIYAELVRGAWSVNGAAVNLASRLCDVAEPGEILVDPRCVELAKQTVVWSEKRTVRLKGHRDGLDVFVVDAVWDQVDPRAEAVALVGRDDERRILDRVLEDVAATGRSRCFRLSGEPGAGKTALVAAWIRGSSARWFYGRARGAPFDGPFDPLATALRALPAMEDSAQIGVGNGAEGAGLAVWWQLVLGGAQPERSHLGRDGVIAAGFRDAVREIGSLGPAVLCLDDMHNAGSDVLEWVLELDAEPVAAPVLVLIASRPDGGMLGDLDGVTLGALDQLEAEQLLADVTGRELSSDLVTRLIERTGGNPLFLKESASWLLSRAESGGVQRAAEELAGSVPESVRLVLSARLDALPAEDKLVLQAASVWGEEGPGDVLTHLVGRPGQRERPAVEASGLFHVRGGRWRFSHSLVRDVVYASLPKRERAALHESLLDAARINQSQRAFHAEAVLSLDVAGDDVERAAIAKRAVVEAARHVRALFAVEARAARDAVTAARLVIEAAEHVAVDEVISLLLLGSAAAAEMTDFAEGEALARRAIELAARSHDVMTMPASLVALGRCLSRLRRLDEAAAVANEALASLDPAELEAGALLGRAQMVLGETFRYESFASWVEHLGAAFSAFTAASDFDGAGEAARLAYYVLSTSPGPEHELWAKRAGDLTESDDLRGKAWIARAEMLSELARGNSAEAYGAAQRAFDLSEASSQHDIQVESLRVLADAGSRCGDHADAVGVRERWLATESEDPHRRLEIAVSSVVGLARSGSLSEAFEELQSVHPIALEFGVGERADWCLAMADVLYVSGDFHAAAAEYRNAADLARKESLTLLELGAEVGQLRSDWRAGKGAPLDLVASVAARLRDAHARGFLDDLLSIWPNAGVERLPGGLNQEAVALQAEMRGDWEAAVRAWGVLGVSEDLAYALERAGQPDKAVAVREILKPD